MILKRIYKRCFEFYINTSITLRFHTPIPHSKLD